MDNFDFSLPLNNCHFEQLLLWTAVTWDLELSLWMDNCHFRQLLLCFRLSLWTTVTVDCCHLGWTNVALNACHFGRLSLWTPVILINSHCGLVSLSTTVALKRELSICTTVNFIQLSTSYNCHYGNGDRSCHSFSTCLYFGQISLWSTVTLGNSYFRHLSLWKSIALCTTVTLDKCHLGMLLHQTKELFVAPPWKISGSNFFWLLTKRLSIASTNFS